MRSRLGSALASRGGLLCAVPFLLAGCFFLPYAGLQADEAAFAAPFYSGWALYAIEIGSRKLPVMVMSYVGALKGWLYAPLLALLPPTCAVLRAPALAVSAGSIWLFWRLLRRIHSRRAAWIGALLLAADATFLLTSVFDWGPSVLQHFLLLAAASAALDWGRSGRARSLALAAFCCGLGLWDKAVFGWMLAGLGAGAAALYRDALRRLNWRAVAAAAIGFALGALPLLLYNAGGAGRMTTMRQNLRLAEPQFAWKLAVTRDTLNGSALFGYIVNDPAAGSPRAPATGLERIVTAAHSLAGEHESGYLAPALLAALAALPWLRRRSVARVLLFMWCAMAVAWTLMCVVGGGGSVHHAVLIWPLPHAILALTLAECGRAVGYGVAALLTASGLLVVQEYAFRMVRWGPAGVWSDAILPLARLLENQRPSRVYAADWGVHDPLIVLSGGRLAVANPPDPLAALALDDARAIWVLHVDGQEQVAGVNARTFSRLRQAGYEPLPVALVRDRNGRPVFQVFRVAGVAAMRSAFDPGCVCVPPPPGRQNTGLRRHDGGGPGAAGWESA
jgi:hypothetical protein